MHLSLSHHHPVQGIQFKGLPFLEILEHGGPGPLDRTGEVEHLPQYPPEIQLNPLPELRRLPTSSWYRLRNLAKQSGASLLAFTPRPLIPAAFRKFTIASAFGLGDLGGLRELAAKVETVEALKVEGRRS